MWPSAQRRSRWCRCRPRDYRGTFARSAAVAFEFDSCTCERLPGTTRARTSRVRIECAGRSRTSVSRSSVASGHVPGVGHRRASYAARDGRHCNRALRAPGFSCGIRRITWRISISVLGRPADLAGTRLPPPKLPESRAVPADHRGGQPGRTGRPKVSCFLANSMTSVGGSK